MSEYISFIDFFLALLLFLTFPEPLKTLFPTSFRAPMPLSSSELFSDFLSMKTTFNTELRNSFATGLTVFIKKGKMVLAIVEKIPPPRLLGAGVNVLISLKPPPLTFNMLSTD